MSKMALGYFCYAIGQNSAKAVSVNIYVVQIDLPAVKDRNIILLDSADKYYFESLSKLDL